MEALAIKGEKRVELGKTATKAVRKAERIPCVLYGGENVVHFSTTFNEIKNLVYTPDFKVADIEVEGQTYRAILKTVQFHPVSDAIVHIDFLQLVPGKKVNVELPVRYTGIAPGIKTGGKLLPNLRKIKVKTSPEHLVDELVLDISHLELGQSIRVRDIKAIEGIEIMNSPGIPVASVDIPRALRSAAAAAEKEGEEEGATEEAGTEE